MSRHANISIFVPHLGCSHRCSFCNQNVITGQVSAPTADDVDKALEIATSSPNYSAKDTEIAFFGGSFTAIDRTYMLELLTAAAKYVKNGTVAGIRLSTRPDAIDREVLDILKENGVTSVELGAQSISDEVLTLNKRGHTTQDVENASKLIKEYGISLGLQMMTGLYGDSKENCLETAKKIIDLKPQTVRVYPTVVLKNTLLEVLYNKGDYVPQTLDEAVDLCTKLLKMFGENNINVIRLGLHTIDMESYVAGPWHPSLRELCESKLYLEKALSILKEPGNYEIYVNQSSVSKMTGQKKSNIEYLKNMGYNCKIKVNNELADYILTLG